jgi:hypothetical protein
MKRLLLPILALLAACLSPTLPLPPPEEPDTIGLSADGVWEVRGLCTPGAVVLVQNLATGLIWGVEDKDGDGHYFVRVEGELCDPADVSELFGTTTSDGTFFLLETRISGLAQGECE